MVPEKTSMKIDKQHTPKETEKKAQHPNMDIQMPKCNVNISTDLITIDPSTTSHECDQQSDTLAFLGRGEKSKKPPDQVMMAGKSD